MTIEDKAFIYGFLEELSSLEKNASWETGVLSIARKVAPKMKNFGGFGQKLDEFATKAGKAFDRRGETGLKKFLYENAPSHVVKDSAGNFKAINPKALKGEGGGFFGFMNPGSFISEASKYTQDLGKGVAKETGFLNKANKFLTNFTNTEIEGIRNARYFTRSVKNVNAGDFDIIQKGNNYYLKRNKGLLAGMKNKIMNPQDIVKDSNGVFKVKGDSIIAKNKLPTQLAKMQFATPGAMVVSGVAMGGTPSEGLMDAAMWNPVTRPIGEIHGAIGMAGAVKNLF